MSRSRCYRRWEEPQPQCDEKSQLAAEQGVRFAQFRLGLMYGDGEGATEMRKDGLAIGS